MAAKKKNVRIKTAKQRAALKFVRVRRRAAQIKLARLLKKHKAGTLRQVDLDTGLKELDGHLKKMSFLEFDI